MVVPRVCGRPGYEHHADTDSSYLCRRVCLVTGLVADSAGWLCLLPEPAAFAWLVCLLTLVSEPPIVEAKYANLSHHNHNSQPETKVLAFSG